MFLLIEPGFCSDVAFIANLVDDDDFNCNHAAMPFKLKIRVKTVTPESAQTCHHAMSSIMNFFKPTKKAGASSGGGQKRPASDSAASPTEKKVCASSAVLFYSAVSFRNGEKYNIIVHRSIYIYYIFYKLAHH